MGLNGQHRFDRNRGDVRSSSPNEIPALSVLAFDDLRRFPGAIRDMHLGIAERAFRGVGPAGRPVQLIHDALSSRAYGAIAAGASGLGKAVDTAMARRGIGEHVSLSTTQKGSFGLAVLNGLIGDQLARDGSALAQPTSVRVQGERIGLDESSLREAFPNASGRVAVFIHGLVGDEFCWSWGAEDTYRLRLAAELDCTAAYLRYNSGLHISENGRTVAALLEELVPAWPVEVRPVAAAGHSIGRPVAPNPPVGRLVGNIRVLVPRATGQGKTQRIPFRDEHGHHVGGTHHLALLNHPDVYGRLRDWLATAPEARGAPA